MQWTSAAAIGYLRLNPDQEQTIVSFVCGRDVFISLPTGYGKSLFWLAAHDNYVERWLKAWYMGNYLAAAILKLFFFSKARSTNLTISESSLIKLSQVASFWQSMHNRITALAGMTCCVHAEASCRPTTLSWSSAPSCNQDRRLSFGCERV